MKLNEIGRRFWRNFEALAYALAYDERDETEARIRRLEADGQSQKERLASLSEQLQALSKQERQPTSPRG